jgi:hypothetical protein
VPFVDIASAQKKIVTAIQHDSDRFKPLSPINASLNIAKLISLDSSRLLFHANSAEIKTRRDFSIYRHGRCVIPNYPRMRAQEAILNGLVVLLPTTIYESNLLKYA